MQKTAETFREEINKTFETNPDKIEMFGEMCDIEVQFKISIIRSKLNLGYNNQNILYLNPNKSNHPGCFCWFNKTYENKANLQNV